MREIKYRVDGLDWQFKSLDDALRIAAELQRQRIEALVGITEAETVCVRCGCKQADCVCAKVNALIEQAEHPPGTGLTTNGNTRLTAGARRMSMREFQDRGLLQEINRRFLHPLGLSLGLYADGTHHMPDEPSGWCDVSVTDAPEGFIFGPEDPISVSDVARAHALDELLAERLAYREAHLGFGIQPLIAEAPSDQSSRN
jgi:hypothetical protein